VCEEEEEEEPLLIYRISRHTDRVGWDSAIYHKTMVPTWPAHFRSNHLMASLLAAETSIGNSSYCFLCIEYFTSVEAHLFSFLSSLQPKLLAQPQLSMSISW
jgi:hypothetical protein